MAKSFSLVEAERSELETVVAAFERAPRLAKLLRYLGEKYFADQADQLTEYNIATEVFGRKATSFVASEDAVARVEAHRLRKKLKTYYSSEGKDHPIQINIPAGTYAPVFCRNGSETTAPVGIDTEAAPPIPAEEFRPDSNGAAVQQPISVETLPPSAAAPAVQPAEESIPRGRALFYVAAAFAVLVIGAGVYAWVRWHQGVMAGGATGADVVYPQPLPKSSGASASVPLRMILGYQGPPVRDSAGDIWQADQYSHGGWAQPQPNTFIARTSDPLIFRYGRFGDFEYNIPLAAGTYELHLYSVDATATARIEDDQNQSVFNVTINGRIALQEFDTVSDAMGFNVANERVLRDISPADDGILHIRISTVIGTPSLSAIQILHGTPHRQLPIRIVMQPNPWTDEKGQLWHPDSYFQGGRHLTHNLPGYLPADAGFYSNERYGHFTYAIPVDPQGRYTVILHFAELHFGVEDEHEGGAGSRVFRVLCNGNTLLDNLDIFREAGGAQPLTKTFSHLKPTAQGKLNLTFEPIQNYATLSALEVLDESH
jgi:hypothetical protein